MFSYKDTVTGRYITQLTEDDCHSRKLYFSSESYLTDDRHIVFLRWQPQARVCTVDSHTGTVRMLTGDDCNAICFGMARDQDVGYLQRGRELLRLDCVTGEMTVVGELPAGAQPKGHYSEACGQVVNAYQLQSGIYALIVIDTQGNSRIVHRSDTPLGHCLYRPHDADTVFFVHETGGDALQRTWLLDLRSMAVRPFYVEHHDEWITHETWSADGSYMTMIKWPEAILRGEAQGNSFREWARGEYHHCAPSRTGLLVADRTSTGEILLLDAAGCETLLATGQQAFHSDDHCHPSFNRAGDTIVFSSPQRGGYCQIAIMHL